jgi:hypothetical protein
VAGVRTILPDGTGMTSATASGPMLGTGTGKRRRWMADTIHRRR